MTMASDAPYTSGEAPVGPQVLYQELCLSYRAVDDFRSRLLGLLPLVSGAGIVAVLGPLTGAAGDVVIPVGLLGVAVTFGFLCHELHGIRKCRGLIDLGRRLEYGGSGERGAVGGQFSGRSEHVIDKPFAAAVIYPAVGATWLYVALSGVTPWAWVAAVVVGTAGFAVVLWYAKSWLPGREPPWPGPQAGGPPPT